MSYRARIGQPSQRQADEFTIRKAYQVTFNSDAGRIVLDHIVQQLCGVDAVVSVSSDLQATEALVRKNIGIMIARYALEPIGTEPKIEVKT